MTDLAISPQRQPALLSPGRIIAARYRLKRIAGAGGMATVWCAYDERLGRPVAIKVISQELAANPVAVTRFAREARIHAGIKHPNLVQVYDYSITAARPYLVMEYIDGATLSERLDRGGFTAATIQTLAAELLSALACVHDRGILHRDIKPANVLLDREGHARLTDLGLAHMEDSVSGSRPEKKIVGTLRFLAPELLQGEPASRRSDLFALGVLLRTASVEIEPTPKLSALIAWLTQHDPQARPQDARAALVALLSEPRVQRTRSRPRPVLLMRNRAIAAAAMIFAVAGSAYTIATGDGNHAASRPHPAATVNHQLKPVPTGVKAASSPR